MRIKKFSINPKGGSKIEKKEQRSMNKNSKMTIKPKAYQQSH